MSAAAQSWPIEPLFLPAATGERLCLFHPAAGTPRGSVVYLHPFAEEMNKSRRMAALQSRALAARGFAVLQIDLYGCGDSSGDFGDARWEIWRNDVELALDWVERRVAAPVYLWGLRLGALLACECGPGLGRGIAGMLLWQPVLSGEQFLTQFLRLRLAGEMIGGKEVKGGTRELRDQLDAGRTLEIAGYDLAPEMARAIDRLRLANLAPRTMPVHWFEIVSAAEGGLPPAARRVADAWTASGVILSVHAATGEPFWTTPEITECSDLVRLTTAALTQDGDGV